MAKRLGARRQAILINENPLPIKQSRWPVKGTSTAAAIAGDTTLTAADSGKLITVDYSSASGDITIILPTPEVGLRYTFVLVTVGSENNCIFQAAAAGQRIGGMVQYNYDDESYIYTYVTAMGAVAMGFAAGAAKGSILDLVCTDTSADSGVTNWMICRGYTDEANWTVPE